MTSNKGQNLTPGEQELFEHHRIEADKGQSPLRIDKFLLDRLPNTSRTKIQDAAKKGQLQVNGERVKPNYKVRAEDVITIHLPYQMEEFPVEPEDIPLDIIHEDKDVLVINKPAGMVVHPGHGNRGGTLVNALLFHISDLADSNDPTRPGLVHRLDKDTSGVMVVAKTDQALTSLSKQFFEKTTERKYIALIWGDLEEDEGTIEGNIGRSPRDRKVMKVFPEGEQGKPARTHFRILERFHYVTLVECRLETGRTHQIRAHFKYLKKPLFNDATYGGNKILKGTTFAKFDQFVKNCFMILPRQALHAASLGFSHPRTGDWMFFEPPWPEDIKEVVERWRKYTKSQRSDQ